MMGNNKSFHVNPKQLATLSEEYEDITKALNKLVTRVNTVKTQLSGDAYENVCKSLETMASNVATCSEQVKNLQETMESIVKTYEDTEVAIVNAASDVKSLNDTQRDTDIMSKEDALDALWELIKSPGVIPASMVPYLQMLLSKITGEKIDATILAAIMASGANRYAFFAEVIDSGWADALKKSWGISCYWGKEAVEPGLSFVEYLKKAFKKELSEFDFGDLTKASQTAGAFAKWADAGVTGILELVENFEENDSTGRALAEATIETVVDVGLGIGATAVTGALLAATGFTAAPAVVVAGIGVGVKIGIDVVAEALWDRDAGEVFSDAICDVVESLFGNNVSMGLSSASWASV